MADHVTPSVTSAPIAYGAVYFRKSNPPRADWPRDYRTAAEDGTNTFRHWFLWSAIEVKPGVFDWDDYDRQLDLAAQHSIKTIIAEMITVAPEWAYRQFPHARLETRSGTKLDSQMHGSCAVGGAPGLCLDNEDVREMAERFLRQLAARYRDHPGLGGYDIWNECAQWQDVCYCPATADEFRTWLKGRYGDLAALGQAWHRYSYATWEDVAPPRQLGPFPDSLDWLQFRIDNAYRLMRWRAQVIRAVDPVHPITAHGIAGSLTQMASSVADDWRAAAEVDSYGFTWVACRKGDEAWKHIHAVDLTRASARGKPFWHAEAQGGPLWMQPQVVGRPREDGRIATPEDLRYWNLASLMGGATGILYPRWRPLLDGPLFGAFGPYGLDGSRTPRSEMAARIAHWANAPEHAGLWRSRPIQGEVGIVYVPETQWFTYAQQGNAEYYARAMQGAYQGFFDANIQPDWVHIDHIDEYALLYLPFPVMLTRRTAERLTSWVEAGGVLIAEGCPGYFSDGGHVDPVQPGLGLDALFGVREQYVEFTPDLLHNLWLSLNGLRAPGAIFLQAYDPTTATPVGWTDEGRLVAADHTYGKGRTRLIGTMMGAGYAAHAGEASSAVFADLLRFAGTAQHVTCSDPRIIARLHHGAGGTYLWVANPTHQARPVRLDFSDAWGPFDRGSPLWGGSADVDGRTVTLTAAARDVSIIGLRRPA